MYPWRILFLKSPTSLPSARGFSTSFVIDIWTSLCRFRIFVHLGGPLWRKRIHPPPRHPPWALAFKVYRVVKMKRTQIFCCAFEMMSLRLCGVTCNMRYEGTQRQTKHWHFDLIRPCPFEAPSTSRWAVGGRNFRWIFVNNAPGLFYGERGRQREKGA